MSKFHWRNADFYSLAAESLPEAAGLYVLMQVRRSVGIPLAAKPIYVGKSKNLRKRFVQHLSPLREHKLELARFAATNSSEFWFADMPIERLAEGEKAAIAQLEPLTKVVRYRKTEKT